MCGYVDVEFARIRTIYTFISSKPYESKWTNVLRVWTNAAELSLVPAGECGSGKIRHFIEPNDGRTPAHCICLGVGFCSKHSLGPCQATAWTRASDPPHTPLGLVLRNATLVARQRVFCRVGVGSLNSGGLVERVGHSCL